MWSPLISSPHQSNPDRVQSGWTSKQTVTVNNGALICIQEKTDSEHPMTLDSASMARHRYHTATSALSHFRGLFSSNPI
ncbi:hypothetical protein M378DRAFT_278196 [Amanita muscaria Koide BX008]|uniref:Uncharacterized protein n=1 Tax=Amanita muscaria (strain Koide BX008) TaxID=946122 RepID=A0A0C2WQV7_AMAMK|nr:hypothetical protein M378DRAFT_278196 [Amanita muscaria Koide BX008]